MFYHTVLVYRWESHAIMYTSSPVSVIIRTLENLEEFLISIEVAQKFSKIQNKTVHPWNIITPKCVHPVSGSQFQ